MNNISPDIEDRGTLGSSKKFWHALYVWDKLMTMKQAHNTQCKLQYTYIASNLEKINSGC